MNSYIIVNNTDFDKFNTEVKALRAMGLAFIYHYIEQIDEPARPRPGGWGGLNFPAGVLPPGRLFDEDDDEYRYSDELGGWTKNGVLADDIDQSFIASLYNYFSALEDAQP